MATTEKTYTLSNTSTGPYTFTFPYIKEADVKVSKNGTELDLTTEYTQATTSITLVDTPEIGDKIRIYRVTDDGGLTATFYPGSAIRSSDLNDNFTQNLYSTQEVVSRYYDIGGTLPLEGDMDAADNKITNVGTPTAQTDAANKEYVDDQDNLLAGTDLTKTKDDTANTVTIDHDAVGASSVNNSDGTVIQDLTISTTGHVTGHGSVNLDGRYYTETELDAGQLDNRYYTETELDAGQLDNRYYTETEADARFFSSDYSTQVNTVYNNIGAVEAVGTDLANSFSNISDYGAVTAAVTSTSGTSDIQTVSDDITNVNTVSGSIANVNTIATTSGLIADIATVAGDATDIGAVAGKETEIGRLGTADAVADMALLGATGVIDDLETCADNITAISGASANATAAAAAQTAAETAETNAETAETNAETAETNAETARDLAEDYKDLVQQTYSDVQGIYTQQRSASYNLADDVSTHTDWGDLASTIGIFANETTDTLLTMATGSSTYNYGGV